MAKYFAIRVNRRAFDVFASRIDEPEGRLSPVERAYRHALDLANPDYDDYLEYAIVEAQDAGAARVASWQAGVTWHQTVTSARLAYKAPLY